PPAAVKFLLGSFLAICVAWFCNIFFKISIHAVAAGGLAMFFILFSFVDAYTSGIYVCIAVLIAGLVCTSRLVVSDHSRFEIYFGLIVGIISQWIAWLF